MSSNDFVTYAMQIATMLAFALFFGQFPVRGWFRAGAPSLAKAGESPADERGLTGP